MWVLVRRELLDEEEFSVTRWRSFFVTWIISYPSKPIYYIKQLPGIPRTVILYL